MTAPGAKTRGQTIFKAASGKQQHHQKVESEGRKRSSEVAAAVAQPDAVKRSGESQHGPQAEQREHTELARGRQAKIVAQSDGRPNSPTNATSATSGSGLAAIQDEPPCVYRLDARVGLRADVSNALLRLLAESRSEKILLADHLVAARRHVARAAVCFSRGGLFCAGHGTLERKGSKIGRASCRERGEMGVGVGGGKRRR